MTPNGSWTRQKGHARVLQTRLSSQSPGWPTCGTGAYAISSDFARLAARSPSAYPRVSQSSPSGPVLTHPLEPPRSSSRPLQPLAPSLKWHRHCPALPFTLCYPMLPHPSPSWEVFLFRITNHRVGSPSAQHGSSQDVAMFKSGYIIDIGHSRTHPFAFAPNL